MTKSRSIIYTLMAIIFAVFTVSASAQENKRTYGPQINIATAKKIAAGAVAFAKSKGWNVAIAIVDNHGFLVYYERLDDTQTASVAIAIDKATTAAMFRRPSRVFENVVGKKGRVAALSLRGVTAIIGGLPIKVDGKVIGGIGASGVSSSQDEEISQAGLDALK